MSISPAPKLRWKDGRAFAHRVQVVSTDLNRYLFYAHPQRAFNLCKAGSAELAIAATDKEIWRIAIIRTPGPSIKTPAPTRIGSYDAQRFTLYVEMLGDKECWDGNWAYAHKFPTHEEKSAQQAILRDCYNRKFSHPV
jgi:hypothetical protein